MLNYWAQIPSYPFFLSLDDAEVTVPAGMTVSANMKVVGTGDFEVKHARCEVQGIGGTIARDELLVSVTDGVRRRWESDPLPLQSFVATPTLDNEFLRAAALCHYAGASQLFKRNSLISHTFTNNSAFDALVRVTYAGCFHSVSECAPGRSMDRIRSLEPTIGPMLIPESGYCGPEPGYLPEREAYPDLVQPQRYYDPNTGHEKRWPR
jgi:hypothetical protein